MGRLSYRTVPYSAIRIPVTCAKRRWSAF